MMMMMMQPAERSYVAGRCRQHAVSNPKAASTSKGLMCHDSNVVMAGGPLGGLVP
jgi:hypothetical protein